jgi:hypothetical protein
MIEITYTIKNDFDTIAGKLETALSKAVRQSAFVWERSSKQLTPVDTGALRASIYTVTNKNTGQASAKADAKARRPEPGAKWVGTNDGKGKFEASVHVGMEYAVFVEYGSQGRPGRPFLTPGGVVARKALEKAVTKALEGK